MIRWHTALLSVRFVTLRDKVTSHTGYAAGPDGITRTVDRQSFLSNVQRQGPIRYDRCTNS